MLDIAQKICIMLVGLNLGLIIFLLLIKKNNRNLTYKAKHSKYKRKVLNYLKNGDNLKFMINLSKTDKMLIMDICDEFLKYSDESTKNKLLKIVWMMKIEKKIIRDLSSKISYKVAVALYKIGKYKIIVKPDILTKFLHFKNDDVKLNAVYALISLYGDEKIEDIIIFISKNIVNINIYADLIKETVCKRCDIIKKLLQTGDENIIGVCIFILSIMENEMAFEVIDNYFKKIQKDETKILILRGMALFRKIENISIIEVIYNCGESENEKIQFWVAKIIGKIKKTESVDLLGKLAESDCKEVYFQAIKSLFRLGTISNNKIAEIKFGLNDIKRNIVLMNEKSNELYSL